jgi:tetratricopeptide (TPR) repeat protein/DNA-binding XRE family transcriptional regulator
VGEPPVTFAALLRRLRAAARLTQEDLAEAAGLSPRSVSDLERGIATSPRRDTIRLLADALGLTGQVRADFEAVGRGRPVGDAGPEGAGSGAGAGIGTAGAVAGAPTIRGLPRDIGSFTGRQEELQELVCVAADAADSGGVVSIHAIGGMAGVGKTAFAVHAAHRLADRFPGGQIFLPLHGHTPGQQPVDPADALASLLLTAGVPAAQIPAGLEERMGLWRDRLAERQLLLVLDDAASTEQVRPLLPGAGGSLVLITSRRHLYALEDATAISLDTLPPGEAAALFVRLAGRPGLDPADPAVREISRQCGFLPLAIGLVARQLHHHPAWSLAGRAADLAAAVNRLELITMENVSVTAAFDLSYDDLTPGQQRLFRLLGLHPGADIDCHAAAALDGTDLAAARRGLEALYDHYLLTEPALGRYRMHDLIRAHSATLVNRLDPERDRDQATERLLDYYSSAAALAESRLARQARTAPAMAADAEPIDIPAMPGREQALAWARAERDNLVACLEHAAARGQRARVIALTAGLAGLLRQDGPWAEALARHAAAVLAAHDLADRSAQAGALGNLGIARRLTGDFPGAARDLAEALDIYRDLGDRAGQAGALTGLGTARELAGDFPGAARDLAEALDIYRDLGDRLGQANALTYLGDVRRLTGDFPGAARVLAEALSIHRDLGDRLGQANALTGLGNARELAGDRPGAARDLTEALSIHRDLGNRLGQANALTYLGSVRRLTGDHQGATRDLEDALGIHRGIGNRVGQANALIFLGQVRRLTGDHPGAAQALADALYIYREIGDPGGEAIVMNELGTLHRVRGDLEAAGSCHRVALEDARRIGSAWDEAHALAGLARCDLAAGRATAARDGLAQALKIFRRIGAAEAAEVATELADITGP